MAEEKRNLNVLDRLRQLFQGNIIIRKTDDNKLVVKDVYYNKPQREFFLAAWTLLLKSFSIRRRSTYLSFFKFCDAVSKTNLALSYTLGMENNLV